MRRDYRAGALMLQHFRTLPFGSLDRLLGFGPALVLAPHPDDESIGCGGLIAASCVAGQPPVLVVVTDGTGSHPGSRSHPPEILRAVREAETRCATSWLGLPRSHLHFLRLPDTAAPHHGDAFDLAASRIAGLAAQCACSVICAPWRYDPHCDHLATHLLAVRVAGITDLRHVSYPVWGWTLPAGTVLEGEPPRGMRLDIAAHLPAKQRAIAAHASQHGMVIADCPGGFSLPAWFLRIFEAPYEVYLDNP